MNGKVFVGQKALSLTEYEKKAPISGVILWVDDENCYEAGDETGTVIEQDCLSEYPILYWRSHGYGGSWKR